MNLNDRIYLEVEILEYKTGTSREKFVMITSQPFKCHAFYENSDSFKASNNFLLQSSSCPEVNSNCLFVRGDHVSQDLQTERIPFDPHEQTEWLEKLRVAVREYNTWLDTRYDAIERHLAGRDAVPPLTTDWERIESPGKRTVRILI